VHQEKPGTILSIDKKGILIAAGEHAILVERIQFPGAKIMAVADWLHAKRDQLYAGMVLQ
jgi:methionyl-tRNA formyltransferase